jgi:two-component system, sensor histidine kinase YesM
MKYIIKWFMDLRIAFKVVICYILMLLVFLVMGIICYCQLNNITTGKVRQMSIDTAKSVSNNLDFMINTLNNQTIIIMSSQTVQNALTEGNNSNSYMYQKQVSAYLADSMNFNEMISSIYIFDKYGDEYYVDSSSFKNISLDSIKESPWYGQLTKLNGQYLLNINGGGTYPHTGGNDVSLVRVVNNIDTQQPIGYIIVNVSASYINRSILQGNNSYNMKVFLSDENNKDIVNDGNEYTKSIINSKENNGSAVIRKISGNDFIISTFSNDLNWKISCFTPFNELRSETDTYSVFILAFVFINILLLIMTFVFVSLLISNPIHKLAFSMKSFNNGELKQISLRTGNDEIGLLKDVYNKMVRQIDMLIENIIKDEAIKRKKELEVLQTQIKPHFLYNSFNAISSLALSGDSTQVYNLITALGTFYKSFLNSGNEEITIEKELEIIDNYLIIQKFRYGEKFIVYKEIDPKTFPYKMPRLTLQPLVENSINHGIRAKKGQGILTIKAIRDEDAVRIIIKDNGIGMDEHKIAEIKNGKAGGIGLGATIERLNLYYNTTGVLNIESTIGEGTAITITIPISEDD